MTPFPDPIFGPPAHPADAAVDHAVVAPPTTRRGWPRAAIVTTALCVALGTAATTFAYRGQTQIRRAATQQEQELRSDLRTGKNRLTDTQSSLASVAAELRETQSERARLDTAKSVLEGQVTDLNGQVSDLTGEVTDLTGRATAIDGNMRGLAGLFPLDFSFSSVSPRGTYALTGSITECSGFDSCAADLGVPLTGDLVVDDLGGALRADFDGYVMEGTGFDGSAWGFGATLSEPIQTCGAETALPVADLRLHSVEVYLIEANDGSSSLGVSRVFGTLRLTTPASATCPVGDALFTFDG